MQILSQTKDSNGKLQIVLEIAPEDASSFLSKEEDLRTLLNEVGSLATAEILRNSDSVEKKITVEGKKYYRKSSQKKNTKLPTDASH